MLSSFDTTLSFLVKECSPFRRVASIIFLGFIKRKEFTCPCRPDLTALVLPDFFEEIAAADAFATPG
jgi:hypothetical protein